MPNPPTEEQMEPPPGWDADLWSQFRLGCIADGFPDPAAAIVERRAYAEAMREMEADHWAEKEAEMLLEAGLVHA